MWQRKGDVQLTLMFMYNDYFMLRSTGKDFWFEEMCSRKIFSHPPSLLCRSGVDLRILKKYQQQNLISATFLWHPAESVSNLYQRIFFLKWRWTLVAGARRLGTFWNGRDVDVVCVAGRDWRHWRHGLAVIGRLHKDDCRAVNVLIFLARSWPHCVHCVFVSKISWKC